MKVSLNLCLLFSLISPVMLLTCKSCVNVKGTKCSKPDNQKCFSGSSCKGYIFNSNVIQNRAITIKSCTHLTSCDPGYYSLTTSGGGFVKLLVDCCTTYNCNKKTLKFSSQPMKPNGLECEGCHKYDVETCERVEMVKCLGEQTKCISTKITYLGFGFGKERKFLIKGCATPLMCDQMKVKSNMNLALLGVTNVAMNCTEAILSPELSTPA